ncbi:MAG: helix-turn-helix transcriptional regulator [Oscillospiraceae bacterium]|nr:helix-turn-helix transcriptional regulator [Oscillospiraceae bacterium]
MNLGENIYRLRTEKGMSQGDLADALEVSRQSVSKWENASAVPELDKLLKMSRVFSVSLDALVSGQPPIPPTECSQESAPREGISVRNIAGIVVLCCSILSMILFLIFLSPIWIILVSLPLGLISVICLLPRRHFWRNTLIILSVVMALAFLVCSAFFGLAGAPVVSLS